MDSFTNLGIDPPDIVKPNPCARKECWFDPTGPNKQKGLEYIGIRLNTLLSLTNPLT